MGEQLANIHGTLLAIMHELEELPDDAAYDLAAAREHLLAAVKRLEAREQDREAGGDG